MNFGVAFGYGSADGRLLGSDTYFYDYNAFKLVLNKRLLGKSSWRLEGILEPTYFQVKFREIEAATDQSVMHYINEYALVLGLLSRWYLSSSLSAYFVGSTGPLYNDHFTSRMKKGLGFSNGLGIGLTYELKGLRIDIRSGIRHVSNAGLNEPNLGYNSSITEIGLLFALDKRPKVTSTLASQ
ncbi:MAG: hypothetical protein HKO90_03660 [Flavobacteriaceae bacterium]|nr:hypothetical protein [Flavobacteriaceae bacterium]